MSSTIFFRFKSRKDALQISFDGTSLSVFEVKREIMSIARLGDGKDFDLDISTSDTNEGESMLHDTRGSGRHAYIDQYTKMTRPRYRGQQLSLSDEHLRSDQGLGELLDMSPDRCHSTQEMLAV